jgi:hypothetical protein
MRLQLMVNASDEVLEMYLNEEELMRRTKRLLD